jgi:hypothetical protein
MALTDLWKSARESIQDKQIQQVLSFAGTGKLADGNATSSEFRSYLASIPSDVLARYATECLTTAFDQSGFALQDIVNQIGHRLSFDVTDGAYRGKKGSVGFDGIWRSSMGDEIVVEVKTTDAYRIDLGVLATYRANLIKDGRLAERNSSILIVVGRQDTGDLEAQIRGSRHAWDIRLISVAALNRLMLLKENVDDPNLIRKICTILTPQEFTKVDGIIDLVFLTAEEVSFTGTTMPTVDQNGSGLVVDQLDLGMGANADEIAKADSADLAVLDKRQQALFHEQCVKRVSAKLQADLVKVSRSVYRTPDGTIALSCTISREYAQKKRVWYWFAFHPYQQDQLQAAKHGFAAFGCGTEADIFLVPFEDVIEWLPGLNQTANEKRHYWHVHIAQNNGRWTLLRRAGHANIDITKYRI